MSEYVSNKTGKFEILLTVYHNCDDTQLFWRTRVDGAIDSPISGCLGFRIERQRKTRDDTWGNTEILRNRVGFSDTEAGAEDTREGYPTKPSSIWPFQRYEWTDFGANNGETVRYRVIATSLPGGGVPGTTTLDDIADSGWTKPISVSEYCGEGISAYFNRGFVMSQYIARLARINKWGTKDIKIKIKELQEPIRRFLSGELRVALLKLLDEAIENPDYSFCAALYELSDDELINRLQLLRGRAHVVLTNGSDKKGDGNEKSRAQLVNAGVQVHDRMLKSKGLGHNKFAILVDSRNNNKPLKAWTGSTNWAPTGLCTQVNNGILIENDKIAEIFYKQWQNLKDAGGDFPQALVDANAESPRNTGNIGVWFTRVRNHSTKNTDLGSDLKALIDYVNSKDTRVILYVMFTPGQEILDAILERAKGNDAIYVRGVVNTVSDKNEEEFKLKGIDVESKSYKTAMVQPEGIIKNFSAWVKEVTRSEFLYPFQNPGIGHAITHSKMIVINPFGDDCKVITGSHNFSNAASEKNDDNFVVIQDNKELAEAYAVACLSTYSHYNWRSYVKDQTNAGKQVWDHLSSKPDWQASYLTAARKEHLALWCPELK